MLAAIRIQRYIGSDWTTVAQTTLSLEHVMFWTSGQRSEQE